MTHLPVRVYLYPSAIATRHDDGLTGGYRRWVWPKVCSSVVILNVPKWSVTFPVLR